MYNVWISRSRFLSAWRVFATTVMMASAAGCGASQSVTASPSWGPTVRGLRVGLAMPDSVPSSGAELNILFQHVSGNEIVLNLGYVLGNGQRFPIAISLLHTTPAGETCKLENAGSHVAGRVDPLILTLRGGGTYTVRLSLDQYRCRDRKVEFAEGRHRIKARFDGITAGAPNLDTPEVARLDFWKGSIESNVVEFAVANAPAH